jgi:NADH-quinone oxidoreductase subunit J
MIILAFLVLIIFINAAVLFNKTINNLISLILVIFTSCFFFFIFFNIEFLMFAYFIVYVGAVMVMFLFVVMSVDVKSENVKDVMVADYLSILLLSNFITAVLYAAVRSASAAYGIMFPVYKIPVSDAEIVSYFVSNDVAIFGEYLFYNHAYAFLFVGLILLVAMVVSVLLCLVFSDKNSVDPRN